MEGVKTDNNVMYRDLPEYLQRLFKENLKTLSPFLYRSQEMGFESIEKMELKGAFIWANSREGQIFWANVYLFYYNIKNIDVLRAN